MIFASKPQIKREKTQNLAMQNKDTKSTDQEKFAHKHIHSYILQNTYTLKQMLFIKGLL